MLLFIHFSFVFAGFFVSRSVGWNFSKVRLPDDVFISRFAIWKNRAFLAAPRWAKWSLNPVTLLEVPWVDPEVFPLMNIRFPPATAYPSPDLQSLGENCTNLLSATALDVDTRGRLWILDSPRATECPAKIVIYDLHNNEEISRENLSGVPRKNLKSLTVDPVTGLWGHRGYIGDPGDESIIVFDFGLTGQRKWWKLHLQHGAAVPRVYTSDLAISRRNKRLYITGTNSLDLFSLDLDKLRHKNPWKRQIPADFSEVFWHGIKLGTSTGLICDSKDGVHYFLVSERASVRWDTKYDLKAESHFVLLQDEHVVSITDYRADSSKNLWGVINPLWCDNNCGDPINRWNFTSRIVKIPGVDSIY